MSYHLSRPLDNCNYVVILQLEGNLSCYSRRRENIWAYCTYHAGGSVGARAMYSPALTPAGSDKRAKGT